MLKFHVIELLVYIAVSSFVVNDFQNDENDGTTDVANLENFDLSVTAIFGGALFLTNCSTGNIRLQNVYNLSLLISNSTLLNFTFIANISNISISTTFTSHLTLLIPGDLQSSIHSNDMSITVISLPPSVPTAQPSAATTTIFFEGESAVYALLRKPNDINFIELNRFSFITEFERTLGLPGMKIDVVEEWNGDIRITFLAPATDVYFLSNSTENVLSAHASEISSALTSQFGTLVELVSIYFAESVNPVNTAIAEIVEEEEDEWDWDLAYAFASAIGLFMMLGAIATALTFCNCRKENTKMRQLQFNLPWESETKFVKFSTLLGKADMKKQIQLADHTLMFPLSPGEIVSPGNDDSDIPSHITGIVTHSFGDDVTVVWDMGEKIERQYVYTYKEQSIQREDKSFHLYLHSDTIRYQFHDDWLFGKVVRYRVKQNSQYDYEIYQFSDGAKVWYNENDVRPYNKWHSMRRLASYCHRWCRGPISTNAFQKNDIMEYFFAEIQEWVEVIVIAVDMEKVILRFEDDKYTYEISSDPFAPQVRPLGSNKELTERQKQQHADKPSCIIGEKEHHTFDRRPQENSNWHEMISE